MQKSIYPGLPFNFPWFLFDYSPQGLAVLKEHYDKSLSTQEHSVAKTDFNRIKDNVRGSKRKCKSDKCSITPTPISIYDTGYNPLDSTQRQRTSTPRTPEYPETFVEDILRNIPNLEEDPSFRQHFLANYEKILGVVPNIINNSLKEKTPKAQNALQHTLNEASIKELWQNFFASVPFIPFASTKGASPTLVKSSLGEHTTFDNNEEKEGSEKSPSIKSTDNIRSEVEIKQIEDTRSDKSDLYLPDIDIPIKIAIPNQQESSAHIEDSENEMAETDDSHLYSRSIHSHPPTPSADYNNPTNNDSGFQGSESSLNRRTNSLNNEANGNNNPNDHPADEDLCKSLVNSSPTLTLFERQQQIQALSLLEFLNSVTTTQHHSSFHPPHSNILESGIIHPSAESNDLFRDHQQPIIKREPNENPSPQHKHAGNEADVTNNNNSIALSAKGRGTCVCCEICGKRFKSKLTLSIHEKTHKSSERPFPCKFCGKGFMQQTHLKQHERCHTKEKPYTCNYCDKMFTQKSGVVQHERIHTGEKPYICKYCPKAYRQMSGLKQHVTKHKDTDPLRDDTAKSANQTGETDEDRAGREESGPSSKQSSKKKSQLHNDNPKNSNPSLNNSNTNNNPKRINNNNPNPNANYLLTDFLAPGLFFPPPQAHSNSLGSHNAHNGSQYMGNVGGGNIANPNNSGNAPHNGPFGNSANNPNSNPNNPNHPSNHNSNNGLMFMNNLGNFGNLNNHLVNQNMNGVNHNNLLLQNAASLNNLQNLNNLSNLNNLGSLNNPTDYETSLLDHFYQQQQMQQQLQQNISSDSNFNNHPATNLTSYFGGPNNNSGGPPPPYYLFPPGGQNFAHPSFNHAASFNNQLLNNQLSNQPTNNSSATNGNSQNSGSNSNNNAKSKNTAATDHHNSLSHKQNSMNLPHPLMYRDMMLNRQAHPNLPPNFMGFGLRKEVMESMGMLNPFVHSASTGNNAKSLPSNQTTSKSSRK
ncbi:unnamed protein product [Gordionus sp. m RMFG-2023]|uniref:GATA zinc finger domain-containing protein 14-like n=1 Tax=Gordionus sp. m RMFG-2023 TaxID=3053472 RepID=UPI0030DF3E10